MKTRSAAHLEEARAGIFSRLMMRRVQIEQAALSRVYAVSEPSGTDDPEYAEGLRVAVSAALDFGISAFGSDGEHSPPVPVALLAQARLAARNGVSLDTVLRRYFAGYSLLSDFVIEEAEQDGLLGGEELKQLLGIQATVFDRLLVALSEEYARESQGRLRSAEERRAERVKRLLAGEVLDTSELGYELEAHHIGVIASGSGAAEAIADLAGAFDCRRLIVRCGERTVWAWLGTRRRSDSTAFDCHISENWPTRVSLAIGEPAHAFAGWRLTHHQAKAALPIAMQSPNRVVRYADVALLASMLQDDLLAASLRQLYLAPLSQERDGGTVLRETLSAYFAADRNVSSAAAALGVKRHTVTSRLRTIEERIGRPLSTCAAEMDSALRLHALGSPLLPHTAFSHS